MRHRVMLTAIMLAGVGVVPVTSQADTIHAYKIVSGRGVVGGRDRVTRVSADGGATWAPAYIVTPFATWAGAMPVTKWISFNATKDSARPYPQRSRYMFESSFSLPTTFNSPSLVVNVMADNSAVVSLNGKSFGSQPCCATGNFETPASFTDATASHFKPGRNTLRIVVVDYGLVGGLDYAARVTWSG
jgi:hypothetical protein